MKTYITYRPKTVIHSSDSEDQGHDCEKLELKSIGCDSCKFKQGKTETKIELTTKQHLKITSIFDVSRLPT